MAAEQQKLDGILIVTTIGMIFTAAGIIIAFISVQGLSRYIQVCFPPKADNRGVTAYHQTPYRKLLMARSATV